MRYTNNPSGTKLRSGQLKGKRIRRVASRNGITGRLLAGLLVDVDGTRFSPTYASKKGRRYDYYICEREQGVERLPALEIEKIVASAVRSLLLNSLDLSKHFPNLGMQEMRLLVAAAAHGAEQLYDPTSAEARRLLKSWLRRVVVTESAINIDIGRNALLHRLLGRSESETAENTVISLSAPIERRRRGSQVRLLLTNGEPAASTPIPSLARSIALARDWADQIIAGRVRTVVDLSAASGMDRCYAGKILKCCALSPSSIEAILQGRHAADLTIEKLTNGLPMDWSKQSSWEVER